MKLINRDTDYAVRALCFIVKHKKKIVSVSELVKELKMPRPFLRRILQVLNQAGVLKSQKGKGGGFRLTKPDRQIFLVDLIKIFQGPLKLTDCLFKRECCPQRSICSLRNKIKKIEGRIALELEPITIASLVR